MRKNRVVEQNNLVSRLAHRAFFLWLLQILPPKSNE